MHAIFATIAYLENLNFFRFEDQLLTEQQLMLQASLLQYPHFGVFPGAAGLYPGLAAASAAGIRFPPSDYYAVAAAAQSMPPGLLLPTMKFPSVSSSSWLGLDRLMYHRFSYHMLGICIFDPNITTVQKVR